MEDKNEEEIKKLVALLREASEHLDYVGYGRDRWERECAGDLRERLQTKLEEYPE